jgi:hypothetical protein
MAENKKGAIKHAPSIFLYQKLLRSLGKKRYYAEVQEVDKTLISDITANKAETNWLGIKAIFRLLVTIARIVIKNIFWVEQWFLLVNPSNRSSESYNNYLQIVPPMDRFWADPDVINHKGINYIFVEEYFYNKKKACISVIELGKDGHNKNSIQVIEKEYHLSYPSITELDNIYYMVPESSANKTIEIYKCSQFPDRWQFVMNLMEDVCAVDTTLFHYADNWWMFTGIPDKSEALPKVRLNLFYSKNLLSNQWIAHPQNPVVSDFTLARPAGKIFTLNGKIYRPSQDVSKSYGSGIHIHEITAISELLYAEKCVKTIKPSGDKNIKGMHTFSMTHSLTVMDAYRRVSRFSIRN